jgi:hypothetical protein
MSGATRLLRGDKTVVWAGALACVLAIACLGNVGVWDDPGNPLDEGLLMVEPELLTEGILPYEDYESFYGPLNTHVLAGVYEVTGPTIEAERAVGLAYRLVLVAGIFALAAYTGVVTALAAGLLAAVLSNGPAALAWFGGLGLVVWALWLLQRWAVTGSDRFVALAGIAVGLAISFRPQFAAAAGLAALPLLVWRPLPPTMRFLGWTLIGAIPMLVHIVLAGPVQVFDSLIVDALFRSGPQSTLPWPSLRSPDGKLFMLLGISVAATLAAAALAWVRAPRSEEARRLASLALLGVGLLPQTLGRADTLHVLNVACVVTALLPTILASPLVLPRMDALVRRLIAVGAPGLVVFALAQTWLVGMENNYTRAIAGPQDETTASYARHENWVERDGRAFPFFSAEQAAQVRTMIATVEELSEPGDRLIVGPQDLARTFYNQTAIYHLFAELEPGTYHLAMAPGTANREGSHLPDDLENADVVVLGTGTDHTLVAPNSELGSTDATEVLTREFCLRGEPFPYRVYARCKA